MKKRIFPEVISMKEKKIKKDFMEKYIVAQVYLAWA